MIHDIQTKRILFCNLENGMLLLLNMQVNFFSAEIAPRIHTNFYGTLKEKRKKNTQKFKIFCDSQRQIMTDCSYFEAFNQVKPFVTRKLLKGDGDS